MAVIALIAWIPICTLLFAFMTPVRAATLAYLGGWLLLPAMAIPIEGFWDFDKILATNCGVALGQLLFCSGQLRGYKVSLADVAVVAFAGGTFFSSIANGLGVYDGVASFGHKLLYYAVPFLVGRVCLKDRRSLLEAAEFIVYGAALYAILAVWEWRISPRIHITLYGVFPHSWSQHYRWGFFRPIVCFPHALGLGLFMAWTSLLGIWLQRAGRLRPFLGVPSLVIAGLPVCGVLVSMSLGPWSLFLLGLGLLVVWRSTRRRWVVWIPILFSIYWMAGRYTGITDGRWMASLGAMVSEKRAASMEYRVRAEKMLLEHGKRRPVFGWGGWGRNRIRDHRGRDLTATDGLWIILVGSYGLVGLACFYLWWCWPVWMSGGAGKELEENPALMVVLVAAGLQAVNLLYNGFLSPILTVMCGGAVTLLASLRREARRRPCGVSVSPPLIADRGGGL